MSAAKTKPWPPLVELVAPAADPPEVPELVEAAVAAPELPGSVDSQAATRILKQTFLTVISLNIPLKM